MSAADRPWEAHGYPGAEPWVPQRPTAQRLEDAVQECRGCDLFRDATQAVMGRGPARARLMLVGEQPGDKEDLDGRPFVGPAGRLLDEALAEAGIAREVVYRTNAVKHFRFTTRGKQRIHKSPARWQVAACGPWLLAELDRVRPEVVVLLGGTAGQAVYGASFRVGASRGRVLQWPHLWADRAAGSVVATTHPAAVLRSRHRTEDLAALVSDLRVAAALLEG